MHGNTSDRHSRIRAIVLGVSGRTWASLELAGCRARLSRAGAGRKDEQNGLEEVKREQRAIVVEKDRCATPAPHLVRVCSPFDKLLASERAVSTCSISATSLLKAAEPTAQLVLSARHRGTGPADARDITC